MSNKSGQLLPCVISKDMSLRLDLLKFLSCLAVIYAHSYSPQYAFFNAAVKPFPLIDNIEKIFALYIASVTVPTFLCVSGFIYFIKHYETTVGQFALRKARGILYPYFIWNTLAVVCIFIAQIPESIRKIFPPGKIIADFDFINWINVYIGWGEKWYPFLYPLWFLPYLFAAFVIVHALRKAFYRYDWLIWVLVGLHLLCSSYLPICRIVVKCSMLFMLLYTMAFFTLSKILIKYQKIIDKTSTLLISAVVFAAAIVLDANRVLPEMRFLILSLYAGLILVFSLSAKVIKYKEKIKKPVTFLAGFSFLIYLTHEFSLSALQAVVYPLIPRQAWIVLATYLLLPLLLAAILITGGYLLKKLLPKVYDFLFNGR